MRAGRRAWAGRRAYRGGRGVLLSVNRVGGHGGHDGRGGHGLAHGDRQLLALRHPRHGISAAFKHGGGDEVRDPAASRVRLPRRRSVDATGYPPLALAGSRWTNRGVCDARGDDGVRVSCVRRARRPPRRCASRRPPPLSRSPTWRRSSVARGRRPLAGRSAVSVASCVTSRFFPRTGRWFAIADRTSVPGEVTRGAEGVIP